MSTFFSFPANPAVLIILKATIVLGAAAATSLVLARATASLRHLMWSASCVALLAIPAIAFVVPRWEVGILPAPPAVTPQSATAFTIDRRAPDPQERGDDELRQPAVATEIPVVSNSNVAAPSNRNIGSSALLLWLGGLIAGLIGISGGMLTLRRLVRSARGVNEEEWTLLLEQLKAELGITREVRLVRSDSACMPSTWGVVRPVILLPDGAHEWSDDRRRLVLLHELVHVRRHDYLTQLVARVCCAVYWFHPMMWYGAFRLRAERELACDEHVLGMGADPVDYATHLVEVARRLRTVPAGQLAVAMARPSQLAGRLQAILDDNDPPRRSSSRARAIAVGGVAAATLPLSAMQPWRSPIEVAPASASVVRAVLAPAQATAADTFRWKGGVAEGKWVEIIAASGDVIAQPSTSGDVEILAVRKSGDPGAYRIQVRTDGGLRVCAVRASASASAPCETDARLRLLNAAGDVRVDFLVKVPRGVGFAAHIGRGQVTARSMMSYVWATTAEGDITISTSDLAEASSSRGSITAEFNTRSWRQNLEFLTDAGDVRVVAPADARMMVEAITGEGKVTSEFGGQTRREGRGARNVAVVGSGGGMLTLHTAAGTVELKRGRTGIADVSDMAAAGTRQSGVDPKPNPDGNPSYAPEPNLHPEIDAGRQVSDDDPTGERVAVHIPAGLLASFDDASLRGAPEGRAIARMRDIAASHRKQHAADLVRERAEWSLTLVRNGRIVEPLRAALRSDDWRVRAYAAWALGETREPSATEALTAALDDSHWRVRMHAAAALQRLGTAQTVEPLIRALSDDHWQVRISAVDALAAIGDRRAVAALTNVAETDARSIVRDAARTAIVRGNR